MKITIDLDVLAQAITESTDWTTKDFEDGYVPDGWTNEVMDVLEA